MRLFCILPLLVWSEPGFALKQEGQATVQAIGLDQSAGEDLFVVDHQKIYRASLRESAIFTLHRKLKAEISATAVAQKFSARDDIDHFALLYFDPRHRSGNLDKIWASSDRQDLYGMIDRLNLRWALGKQRLTAGRFAIDLSKSYIFRPNDLFAPLRANHLDRAQKLGVDAIQLSGPLAPLGEWKLMAVAGYEEAKRGSFSDEGRFQEPSNRRSAAQSSLLAHYMNTFKGASLQTTIGTFRNSYVLLAGVEAQLSDAIGWRWEGKYLKHRQRAEQSGSTTLGFDWRIGTSSVLIAEGFYNGEGLSRVEKTEEVELDPFRPLFQLGLAYFGVGAEVEFTELLKGRLLLQDNVGDHSLATTGSLSYSASDRIDLNLLFLMRQGAPPVAGQLKSEFGSYPQAAALEAVLRW